MGLSGAGVARGWGCQGLGLPGGVLNLYVCVFVFMFVC